MAKTFMLKILTPEKTVVSEEATKVFTKTPTGEIQFLYGHEHMILSVVPCISRYVDSEGNEKSLFTSKGIVTVEKEKVTFLIDSAEFKDEIDLERAKKARERALTKLKEGSFEDVDIIKASLERADIRIKFKSDVTNK